MDEKEFYPDERTKSIEIIDEFYASKVSECQLNELEQLSPKHDSIHISVDVLGGQNVIDAQQKELEVSINLVDYLLLIFLYISRGFVLLTTIGLAIVGILFTIGSVTSLETVNVWCDMYSESQVRTW